MDIKEILEKIAYPARSNKDGFYVTEKLDAIASVLYEENSPFQLVEKTEHAWIFGQKEPEPGMSPILISSHADIVTFIKSPFSKMVDDDTFFHGTYDNLGTNAAAVAMMLNHPMPEGTFFAFTSEEETGKCLGADYALSYIRMKTGCDPLCIALDVTDEGYDTNRLCTMEGFHAKTEEIRQHILLKMLSGEGNEQSFEVVKLHGKDDVSCLPKEYVAKGTTVFDESIFYAHKNCNSFSLCLPSDGEMHSDSGLYVKAPVMRGYELCLAQCIYLLTNTNRQLVDKIKQKKDDLVNQAKTIHRKVKYTYVGYDHPDPEYGYYRSGNHYADDDYEDDDYGDDLYNVVDEVFSNTDWTSKSWYFEDYDYILVDLVNLAFAFDVEDVAGYISEAKAAYDLQNPEEDGVSLASKLLGFVTKKGKDPVDAYLEGVFETVKEWREEHRNISPHYLDDAIDEAFSMAESYKDDEIDVFLQDIFLMYGFDQNDPYIRNTFTSVFASAKETYEEDYYEDDYDFY